MIDFFQKEAQECKRLAAQATGKKDREYWLHMAERWEWLVQQNGVAKIETAQPSRSSSVVQKRLAKPQLLSGLTESRQDVALGA